VIFGPSGVLMDDHVIARSDMIAVMAVETPVMALEDVLVTMLCALDEHSLDYSQLVAIARALREQVDWPRLWARTSGSPTRGPFGRCLRSSRSSRVRAGPAVRRAPRAECAWFRARAELGYRRRDPGYNTVR
jgi:hypothetical protein